MRSKPNCSQQGMALAIVLIMMVCITIIALGFLALYNKRLVLNTSIVHEYTAQYVAETGLHRYLWVLNNDPYNVNNFVNSTKQLINGASYTYTYDGYSKEAQGYYAIECMNPPADNISPSSLNLTCTGWLASDPTHQYSFDATVQARSFCQFLSLTNQETEPDGKTVYWGPDDSLNGGLFTNSIIHTKDDENTATPAPPIFNGPVYYADTNQSDQLSQIMDFPSSNVMTVEFPYCKVDSNYNIPLPMQADSMTFPNQNEIDQQMIKVAEDGQGIYLTGRTCIWLHGNQMDIQNAGYKGGLKETDVPLPTNGVIYVDGLQSSQDPTNPNTYDPGDKFNASYGNVFVSGTLSGQLTIYAKNNIYLTAGDPTSAPPTDGTTNTNNDTTNTNNLVTYSSTSTSTPWGQVIGDPVWGNYATATAANSPSGSPAPSTDMLGLVADNYVMILRYGWPIDNNGNPANGNPANGNMGYGIDDNKYSYFDYSPSNNPEIDATIMSLNRSFLYECYWPSPFGWNTQNTSDTYNAPTLTIQGAIIQYYRGAVSGGDIYTGSSNFTEHQLESGYQKNYWFDFRMRSEMPPYFLLPENSGWGVLNWSMTTNKVSAMEQATSIAVMQDDPDDQNPVSNGTALQLTAAVSPDDAPQTVMWSFSDSKGNSTTDPTYDPATGSTIDPYTGLLTAGTAGTGTVYVTATANGSTHADGTPVMYTATIYID